MIQIESCTNYFKSRVARNLFNSIYCQGKLRSVCAPMLPSCTLGFCGPKAFYHDDMESSYYTERTHLHLHGSENAEDSFSRDASNMRFFFSNARKTSMFLCDPVTAPFSLHITKGLNYSLPYFGFKWPVTVVTGLQRCCSLFSLDANLGF